MEGLRGKELPPEACLGTCIANGGVEERANGGEYEIGPRVGSFLAIFGLIGLKEETGRETTLPRELRLIMGRFEA